MAVKRSGGLLNVLVASGWLLLVASFGILITPHNYAPAHGGAGKIAVMWIIISAITMARAPERTSGMSANDPKRIVRTNYRSDIDRAKIHKFVAANNKKRLTPRPNYSPLG